MATWSISELKRNVSDGGVIVAHWNVVETETSGSNVYEASSYGSTGFTYDVSASDFIAYASLTEADVIGWVKADVNVSAIEAKLTSDIADQKSPPTANGVPW